MQTDGQETIIQFSYLDSFTQKMKGLRSVYASMTTNRLCLMLQKNGVFKTSFNTPCKADGRSCGLVAGSVGIQKGPFSPFFFSDIFPARFSPYRVFRMDQGYLVGFQSNCYPSQKLFISIFPVSVNLSFVPFLCME